MFSTPDKKTNRPTNGGKYIAAKLPRDCITNHEHVTHQTNKDVEMISSRTQTQQISEAQLYPVHPRQPRNALKLHKNPPPPTVALLTTRQQTLMETDQDEHIFKDQEYWEEHPSDVQNDREGLIFH